MASPASTPARVFARSTEAAHEDSDTNSLSEDVSGSRGSPPPAPPGPATDHPSVWSSLAASPNLTFSRGGPGQRMTSDGFSMSPLFVPQHASAARSLGNPPPMPGGLGGHEAVASPPTTRAGSAAPASVSPTPSRSHSPRVPLFHSPRNHGAESARHADLAGGSENVYSPSERGKPTPHSPLLSPTDVSRLRYRSSSESDMEAGSRNGVGHVPATPPQTEFRRQLSDSAADARPAADNFSLSSALGTPPRRGSLGDRPFQAAVEPARVPSPHAGAPPSADAVTLMRKIVDTYCRAIDVAAEYGAAVAVPPSAKAELLRQAVTSADWPTLAGTMLSRAHAMFAQCLGLQHASIACVTKLRGLLHAHLGAHAAAVECFRAVIALCESEDVEVDEQSTAGVKYNLGVCLMACGDYAGAVSSFTSVRDVYARCRGEWHPSVTAVTAKLAQAQRAGMESQYTHLYSAALGAYADKRYKDAHDAFIAALALLPNDAQTAYHVATCCVHVGCCEGGVDWFSRAVEWGYADIASVLSDPDMAHLCTDVRFLRLLSRANAEDEESDVDVD